MAGRIAHLTGENWTCHQHVKSNDKATWNSRFLLVEEEEQGFGFSPLQL